MRGNDEIDGLIDKALASYGAEPPLGLETRVMRRVRATRTRRNIVLSFVPAIAACFAMVVMLGRKPEVLVPPPTAIAVVPRAQETRVVQPVTTASVVHRRTSKRRSLPKQDVFPTPRPLTQEERLLLSMAQLPPEELKQVIAATEPKDIQPIEIEPIKIEPLHMDGD